MLPYGHATAPKRGFGQLSYSSRGRETRTHRQPDLGLGLTFVSSLSQLCVVTSNSQKSRKWWKVVCLGEAYSPPVQRRRREGSAPAERACEEERRGLTEDVDLPSSRRRCHTRMSRPRTWAVWRDKATPLVLLRRVPVDVVVECTATGNGTEVKSDVTMGDCRGTHALSPSNCGTRDRVRKRDQPIETTDRRFELTYSPPMHQR